MTLTGDMIGQQAAKTMESLEKEYAGDDDATIVGVALIVAVTTMENPDGPSMCEDGYTVTHVQSNELVNYKLVGLITSGLRTVHGD